MSFDILPDIEKEKLLEYWDKATDQMEYDPTAADQVDSGQPEEYNETLGVLRRWTRSERRLKKKRSRRAHRDAPNWKTLKPKKGYKRVKEGKKYIRIRMTATERRVKERLGKYLGKKKSLRT